MLKANVIEPTSAGRHPAIVFVNSWGLGDLEYLAQAGSLADAGYTVLSYCARGWWSSGGQIDTAGPKDIADASTVVSWLTANTTADPAHIGMAGVSYGAGISLIAAAFDPRVRAVAALSGWSDLVYSLYGDNTRRQQAARLLQVAAQLLGRPSAELTANLDSYFGNRDIDTVKAFGRVRSAATYVDRLNTNAPAILLANAYGDSLFGPDQLVSFYQALSTPKRLELAAGDHAVVELTGLLGLDNHVWTSVHRWFDSYLRGVDTGITAEKPIQLKVRTSGATEGYAAWGTVTGHVTRFGLQDIPWYAATGALGGSAGTGWSHPIWTGLDTTAGGGIALITNGLEVLTGEPPTDWLPSVSRVNGAVWESATAGSTLSIRGIPTLHLTLRSAPARGTLVAYLYDVDATDTGKLIALNPVTWLSTATTVECNFPVVAYDLPAGHRLGLVLDTEDPLFLDLNTVATALSVAGSSWLDVPVK